MRKASYLLVTLLLCLGLGDFPTLAQETPTIEYGQMVNGEISDSQPAFQVSFRGEEGDSIYASAIAPNSEFWPVINLKASSGLVLWEGEGGFFGGFLAPFILPGGGTYTLEVTREEGESASGAIEVWLDRVEMQATTLGSEYSGTLPGKGAAAFFTFEGEAQSLVSYHAIGSDLGMAVVAPSGNLAFYTGSGDNLLEPFNVLQETGTYSGVVQTGATGESEFSVRVTEVEPLPLASGQTLTGTLSESAPAIFAFESEQGKLWELNATVADADYASVLEVYSIEDPCCSIVSDYSSGPNGQPRIDPFIPPATATYYAVLSFDDYTAGDATRNYEMTFRPSSMVSLVPGSEVQAAINEQTGTATYAYNGQEGETIRITLTRTGGEGAPDILVFGPQDTGEIVAFHSWVLRRVSFEITLPAAGLYLFALGNAGSDESTAEFSLLVEQVS